MNFTTPPEPILAAPLDPSLMRDVFGPFLFCIRAVVEDVLAAVTHVHVSGMMHERVLADIGRYIHPSHRLEHMLKTLRNAGKKLFSKLVLCYIIWVW